MRTPARLALLVSLAVLLSRPAPAAEDMTRLEKQAAKEAEKIAATWVDLARDLAKRGMRSAAADALGRAEALLPEAEGLKDVRAEVDALEGDKDLDPDAEKLVAKAKAAAAKGCERMSKVFARETEDPRYTRYLIEAFLLEPTKPRQAKVADLAKKAPLLLQVPGHPMAAYVSFPSAWKPGKEWPVLVSVEGAGSNFKGNAEEFRNARGSRPFITVSPHALSCTNEVKLDRYPAYSKELVEKWNGRRIEFDVPGLLGILDFLHEGFGASEKVAITGFSGGGFLCYAMVLEHPERILCAAPACPNFQPGLAEGAKTPDDGGPPIHIMTGEKDPNRLLTHGTTPPGIEEQTDWAVKALADHGFTKVTRVMLPGVAHQALPAQVWTFLDSVTGD